MPGLLIFIGLILVILNGLSIVKQNKSFKGMLGNAIENTNDYDIKLGELRREFSESILELQSEIMDMKEMVKSKSELNKNYNIQKEDRNYNYEKIEKSTSYLHEADNIENSEKIFNESKKQIIIDQAHNSNSEKVESIKRLVSEGLSVEEISEILHLGKGEVLLIKDLYIR